MRRLSGKEGTKKTLSNPNLIVLVVLIAFLFFDAKRSISSVQIVPGTSVAKIVARTDQNVAIDILMNQYSSYVQSDVSKIVHIPSETRIEVHLKPNRRCQNPYLQARISGWSLSMIEFQNITNNVVVGNYDLQHMPMSGKYYLEVLVVLCEKYGDDYRSMNIKQVDSCLEINAFDDHHQLTAGEGNATLELVALDDSKLSKDFKGRWVHKSLLSNDRQLLPKHETLRLKQPHPLYTPYQPIKNERAFGKQRRDVMYQYFYQWNELGSDAELNRPGLSELLSTKQQQGFGLDEPNASKTNVCFVGASHSEKFRDGCDNVLRRTLTVAKEKNLTTSLVDDFKCDLLQARFPSNIGMVLWKGKILDKTGVVNEDFVHKLEEMQCTHIVVGLFQWYFSFVEVINSMDKEDKKTYFSFDEWKDGMTHVAKVLGQRSPSSSIRRVYFRSTHPNGFNARHISCPRNDYRIPYNAKLADEILREIANEHPGLVSFMDTSFLMDAIWDSAKDWNHYADNFMITEAQLVLSQIMNDS